MLEYFIFRRFFCRYFLSVDSFSWSTMCHYLWWSLKMCVSIYSSWELFVFQNDCDKIHFPFITNQISLLLCVFAGLLCVFHHSTASCLGALCTFTLRAFASAHPLVSRIMYHGFAAVTVLTPLVFKCDIYHFYSYRFYITAPDSFLLCFYTSSFVWLCGRQP